MVKALHFQPAGRGFDSRICHWIFFFSDIILPVRTMALESTQPSNRNEYQVYFLGVKAAGA